MQRKPQLQKTRQAILEYLKKNGPTTVDELAGVLRLTSVTIRHHLDILRSEHIVAEPVVRRRTSRGRPQYVFTLTGRASEHLDKNYDDLAAKVLAEVKSNVSPQLVNVIFEGVATRLSAEAPQLIDDEPMSQRLDRAIAFLTEHGYMAHWERKDDGYLLHTCNCPYESLAPQNPELCNMDMALVGKLLGVTPQRVDRLADGGQSCAYLIREQSTAE